MKNIRKIFNPSKITLSGKSTIVDTDDGKIVIKEKNKDIESLYEYLESRDIKTFPSIIDEYDDNYVYEYLNDVNIPLNQKAEDFGKVVASLHYKTIFFKSIVVDDIKELYEKLNDNILYFEDYYNKLFNFALEEEYIRPSLYILLINSTKINALVSFLKSELEKWYNLIIEKDKIRVCYIHNNLTMDHFISNKLISWDNYNIDSPVLDIVNLYKNDYNKYDFEIFLKEYLSRFELLDDERHLLFINLSLPSITYFSDDELENTITVSKFLEYINNTEKLIRPYYLEEKIE